MYVLHTYYITCAHINWLYLHVLNDILTACTSTCTLILIFICTGRPASGERYLHTPLQYPCRDNCEISWYAGEYAHVNVNVNVHMYDIHTDAKIYVNKQHMCRPAVAAARGQIYSICKNTFESSPDQKPRPWIQEHSFSENAVTLHCWTQNLHARIFVFFSFSEFFLFDGRFTGQLNRTPVFFAMSLLAMLLTPNADASVVASSMQCIGLSKALRQRCKHWTRNSVQVSWRQVSVFRH